MTKQQDFLEIMRDVLRVRSPRRIREQKDDNIHAAVLVPLFNENGEYRLLFTKRTNTVENHKGQISFPGGAVDERDRTLEETALREAYEEIGLLKEDVDVLGRIDDMTTVVSNFIVHPFVGLIPYPYDFRINSEEVDRLIEVPFNVFLSGDPRYKRSRAEVEGVTYPGPAYLYHGDLIWGATARILGNLIGILRGELGMPIRTE